MSFPCDSPAGRPRSFAGPRGLKPAARWLVARWVLLLTFAVPCAARGQDFEADRAEPDTQPAASRPATQPAVMTHEKFLAEARREYTVSTALRGPDGAPLKLDAKKRVAQADDLMKQAQDERASGDYEKAAQSVTKALGIYTDVLGAEHYLTVASRVLQRALDDFAKSAAAAQKSLREADQMAADAQAASEKGQFAEAERLAEKVVRIRTELLRGKHPEVAEALRQLGAAQLELQLFEKSKANIQQAVTIFEQHYGRNHPKTAMALDRLGWMYINEGRSEEAIRTLRDAAYILRSTCGDTGEAGEVLDNLGTAFALNGDLKDALNKKLHGLIVRETVLGPKARDTAVSLSNLAWLYSKMGMMDDALKLREQAYETFVAGAGPDHTYTKLELTNLCMAYEASGQLDKAIALYKEQIARDDRQPEVIDTNVIRRCTALASVLFGKGDFATGRAYVDKAVERGKYLLGTTAAPAAVHELYSTAQLLMRYRLLDEAAPICATVFEEDARRTTPSAASVRRCEDYGQLLGFLGRTDDAVKVWERAVKDAEKLFGKGERQTATSLIGYSEALCAAGKLVEAETAGDAVVKIGETKLPPRSLGLAHGMLTVGRVYNRQKRWELARFVLEDGETIFRLSSSDLLGSIECQLELARCYQGAGDAARATAASRQAVELARELRKMAPSLYSDGHLARALWHQLERGELDESSRSAARAEIRTLLEGLREARALDAENRRWLESLQ